MKRFSQVKGCLQLLGLKVEGLWEKCVPKWMTSPFLGQFCMGSHGFIYDTSRAEAALGTATDMPHQTALCCLWAGPRVQHLQQNTKFIPCMCKTYSAFWWLAFSPTIHHKCRLTCFAARSFCAEIAQILTHTRAGSQLPGRAGEILFPWEWNVIDSVSITITSSTSWTSARHYAASEQPFTLTS